MKRNRVAILLILIAVFLSGCFKPCKFEFKQPVDQIESIEIVCLQPYHNMVGETLTVVKVLKEVAVSEQEIFVESFLDVQCFRYVGDHTQVLEGDVIRITYEDGAFELIDAGNTYYATKDGRGRFTLYFFDKSEFESFIEENK